MLEEGRVAVLWDPPNIDHHHPAPIADRLLMQMFRIGKTMSSGYGVDDKLQQRLQSISDDLECLRAEADSYNEEDAVYLAA